MFHQPHNTFGTKIYNSILYCDYGYQTHFHKSFEVWYCAQGHAEFFADGVKSVINGGEYMIIFPYVAHAFSVKNPSKLWVAVFSGDFVPELDEISKKSKPEIKTFGIEKNVQKFLDTKLMSRDCSPDEQMNFSLPPRFQDVFIKKSGLYAITDAFIRSAKFLPSSKSDDIAVQIISYIENNFTSDITLASAADALGYNYQHISRVFKKTFNVNFRSLINQYRFDYACKLLEQGGLSVTQAALDAGFQSVRNFNRIYREKTGHSPKRQKLSR